MLVVKDGVAMSDEVKVADKWRMLEQQLQVWKNTVYDATTSAKVAKAIGDNQIYEFEVQRATRATKAVDFVEEMLAELLAEGGETD
jgi:hypothetical protein